MNEDNKVTNEKDENIVIPETEQEVEASEDTTQNEEQETVPEEKSDAEKLAEAEEAIARLKDQLLRQVAEFDNYRKRTLKEKTELILSGGEKVLTALLPVLDDLDRAQANIEASDNVETLREGVNLIIDKLVKTLSTQGLKRMDTQNALFDTDFHEAIALIPATEEEQKGKVMDCVQPGYMLNEKVIRHAKVVVGQ